MIYVLAQRVLAVAPGGAVKTRHPAELRQHGVLVRTKLVHRVLLLLLLRRPHHAGVVLAHVSRVRRARLGLRGDVVRGRGPGLHARRRAGVLLLLRGLRLRLGPRRRLLRRAHLVGQRLLLLGLELVRVVRRLGRHGRLLGAHGVAVLGRRAPGAAASAQMLLLLLQQPLVQRLLQQSLRRLLLRGLQGHCQW